MPINIDSKAVIHRYELKFKIKRFFNVFFCHRLQFMHHMHRKFSESSAVALITLLQGKKKQKTTKN